MIDGAKGLFQMFRAILADLGQAVGKSRPTLIGATSLWIYRGLTSGKSLAHLSKVSYPQDSPLQKLQKTRGLSKHR
jgi:hypothetical protein